MSVEQNDATPGGDIEPITAAGITLLDTYREVLMPAPRIDFPDDEGNMVPIMVRGGKELRGSGEIRELTPTERCLLTFWLQHAGVPLSRRAFEAFGFGADKSESVKKGTFTRAFSDLDAKLWLLAGKKDAMARGPNDGKLHSYRIVGLMFVCGDGTTIVDQASFIEYFPKYQPAFNGAFELPPAATVRLRANASNFDVPSLVQKPKLEPKPMPSQAKDLSHYGQVNKAPSSAELLRMMRERNKAKRGG